MASSVPRPVPLHNSTVAASSTHGAASAPAVAVTPQGFTSALQANALRLEMIVHRLAMHFRNGVRNEEFSELCFFLARGIDYALTYGDLPSIAHHLPSLIRQVFEQRKCTPLQSAILVLMISVKNACQNGWFHLPDINEILRMTNELCSNFCTAASVSIDPAKVIGTISEVIPRYYPQLKFCRPVVSFEAKAGYEILLADFQIPRNTRPEEEIVLFVTQTDNLETSSCIISPPQVSILINGKALEKRSNVSLDHGPQFPTDITKMLKYGTNIIQALGYFSGNYIITIAFISKITSTSAPILKDYVPPVVSTGEKNTQDFDIIEGPSRISLNCPISLRRIKTPVKGFLCKHHQCFDYDNFLEMNSRKPSWRCPYCNQPTSCIDLRVDQNMIKILKTVGEDIADVVISADGSWEMMADHNGSSDQLEKGSIMVLQHDKIESKSNRQSINLAHVVDLTMEQNGTGDAGVISGVVESLNDSSNQICKYTFDTKGNTVEDYKGFSAFEFHSQEASHPIANDTQLRVSSSILIDPSFQNAPLGTNALGTLETLVPNCVLNPVMSNTTGINEEPTVNLGILQSSFSLEQGSQARHFAGNTQVQRLWLDNSAGSSLAESVPIPTHVCREPMTFQTLPVEIQTSGTNVLSSSSIFSSDLLSRSYPMDPSRIGIPDPLNASSCNRDSDSSILQLHSTKQGFGLPTSNLLGLRGQVAQQGVPSNRASLPTSLNIQNYIQQFGYRTNQILNHSTSALPHIPYDLSMQCRTVSSACQLSPPVGSLLMGTALLQASRTAPSMTTAHNSLMIAGSDPLQCQVGSSYPFGTSHHLPELPAQPNWQPTGRMRGSLEGLAYTATLNHYSSHPMQEVSVRPSPLLGFNELSSLLNFSNTNTSGALP
ncbi:hypothetical protein J5N97_019445 [Dioscorea zingiberensis]|uniref:SP-RING-type domain-containing protein n=1 Tax=Dioscorea zingiberensis TaxID=325984 RepID=A0A9D5CE02_9LILI|nr:hypothetical protein J5N97_019445 [Dioscorea zingiberensis]